jgi:hypothetical protein
LGTPPQSKARKHPKPLETPDGVARQMRATGEL